MEEGEGLVSRLGNTWLLTVHARALLQRQRPRVRHAPCAHARDLPQALGACEGSVMRNKVYTSINRPEDQPDHGPPSFSLVEKEQYIALSSSAGLRIGRSSDRDGLLT